MTTEGDGNYRLPLDAPDQRGCRIPSRKRDWQLPLHEIVVQRRPCQRGQGDLGSLPSLANQVQPVVALAGGLNLAQLGIHHFAHPKPRGVGEVQEEP